MAQNFFTETEVTKILCICKTKLWYMKKRGEITPSLKVGARPRYTEADLERAVTKKTKK